jgi:hypothetical protein
MIDRVIRCACGRLGPLDSHDSGASPGNRVEVRVLSSSPSLAVGSLGADAGLSHAASPTAPLAGSSPLFRTIARRWLARSGCGPQSCRVAYGAASRFESSLPHQSTFSTSNGFFLHVGCVACRRTERQPERGCVRRMCDTGYPSQPYRRVCGLAVPSPSRERGSAPCLLRGRSEAGKNPCAIWRRPTEMT